MTLTPTSVFDHATIDRVAAATCRYPFKRWGFGESIAMEALLAAGGEHAAFASGFILDWVDRHDSLQTEPLAHVAPGVPLLALLERETGRDEAILATAHELAGILQSSQLGSHGAQIHRPDLAGWEHEVWVDCMHLDAPFLVRLARAAGDETWSDLAAEIILGHARVLQDDGSGLFSHGFNDLTGLPNRIHWGRGQGWALLGLADTAEMLSVDSEARAEIIQRLAAQVDGLARTETGSGSWSTVVDEPSTRVEPSVSAFVALGIGRAVRFGLVDSSCQVIADRALETTVARIQPDGALPGVSDATPVGADAGHYDARGSGVFPWGQGPALLAMIERHAEGTQE